HAERRPGADRGALVGLLYGTNTLGAVLGCLGAGFVAVERFGLLRTAGIGGALGVSAALLASFAREEGPPTARDEAASHTEPVPARLLAVAAIAGFAGLGAEVVWTRLFSLIIPNTVYAFTQVLAAVLLGIALGALIAGAAARRLGSP